MRSRRNSNGSVPRLANGAGQHYGTGQECCCTGGCTNATGCTATTHAACNGAKYAHINWDIHIGLSATQEGEASCYGGDGVYELTSEVNVTLDFDFNRLWFGPGAKAWFAERFAGVISDNHAGLTAAQGSIENSQYATQYMDVDEWTAIGAVNPAGVTLTYTVDPAIAVVTTSGDAPTSFTETVLSDFYDISIAGWVASDGTAIVTFSITITYMVLYYADATNWFVANQGGTYEGSRSFTLTTEQLAAFCEGTAATLSGDVSVTGSTGYPVGPDPFYGTSESEFNWIGGFDPVDPEVTAEVTGTITRLATAATEADFDCRDCASVIELDLDVFDSLGYGTGNWGTVNYGNYHADVMWKAVPSTECESWENQAVCSWGGPAEYTPHGESAVSGQMILTVWRFSGLCEISFLADGGSEYAVIRRFKMPTMCEFTSLSLEGVSEVIYGDQDDTLPSGDPTAKIATVTETLTITELDPDDFNWETRLDHLHYCDNDCRLAEDIYDLHIQCEVGTSPTGWSDISLERPSILGSIGMVWQGITYPFTAQLIYADGTWSLTVTHQPTAEVAFTATWAGTCDDPTGTHAYSSAGLGWDDDCGALAAIIS